MPDHSFSEEIFPNISSKSPLMQVEAIASCPITSYLGEETNTCLTTTSFQVVVESNKVPSHLCDTQGKDEPMQPFPKQQFISPWWFEHLHGVF